ncbi:MAG: hypothetical protein K0Q72_5207 [Armatimonadetes bacterium]|jgi:hypothetical protein|nr:hypothetical protein [Armatimonadota bacterium]
MQSPNTFVLPEIVWAAIPMLVGGAALWVAVLEAKRRQALAIVLAVVGALFVSVGGILGWFIMSFRPRF